MTETDRKAYVRLTDAQWAEAGTLWEVGDASLSQLAERFGAREETLSRGLKARGYEKGVKAAEHAEKVVEHVEKTLMDDAAKYAERVRETKEQHYRYSESIAKLVMAEIVKAQRADRPFSNAMDNIKALRQAATTLAITRGERWAVLGLDKEQPDPDELPELLVSVLTAEQIAEINQGDGDLDDLTLDELEDGIEVEGFEGEGSE